MHEDQLEGLIPGPGSYRQKLQSVAHDTGSVETGHAFSDRDHNLCQKGGRTAQHEGSGMRITSTGNSRAHVRRYAARSAFAAAGASLTLPWRIACNVENHASKLANDVS